MNDAAANDLVARMIREVKRPDSGKLELPAEDIRALRQLTKEIVLLSAEGNIRKRWGPNMFTLSRLSKLILTDEQVKNMGTGARKGDVVKEIASVGVVTVGRSGRKSTRA